MVTLARLLAQRDVVATDRLQPFTARPPTEPVSFGALAAGADEPDEHGPEHERGGP
jgi:sarcosine oxidase subunit beta